MTTANNILPTVITSSPNATLIAESDIVVKYGSQKPAKCEGAKLSHAAMRRLAKHNKPPQSWYDETNG